MVAPSLICSASVCCTRHDVITEAAPEPYIRALPNFVFRERQPAHQHMGATIAEAVLQAGMRYHAQVVPRVARILRKYPDATTSEAFLAVLTKKTPEHVINIHGRKSGHTARKAKYTRALTKALIAAKVQTEAQLREWLESPDHAQQLLDVNGVGKKTVSYLKLLVGCPDAVAVDTRLRAFLNKAGIVTDGYDDTVAVVSGAAQILGVTPATLDVSIWIDADH